MEVLKEKNADAPRYAKRRLENPLTEAQIMFKGCDRSRKTSKDTADDKYENKERARVEAERRRLARVGGLH
jgi:hypothetical protein